LKAIESGQPIQAIQAKEEVAITVTEATTLPKLQYDDYEKTVLQQSSEQEINAYEIAVSLREDCLLKAARVFMVFDILEKSGDVIKSVPTVDQLEEEKFDQQFQVALLTKESAEEIQKKIMKVSEVDSVIVTKLSQELFANSATEITHDEPTSVEVAEKPVVIENNPKPEANNQTKAPSNGSKTNQHAASKTIRVSIERLDILMNLFEELVIDRGRLQSISTEVNHGELNETVER
ncbi:chemotaxis protein CheA, partial [Butyricicoccus sp. 1XD8-22]